VGQKHTRAHHYAILRQASSRVFFFKATCTGYERPWTLVPRTLVQWYKPGCAVSHTFNGRSLFWSGLTAASRIAAALPPPPKAKSLVVFYLALYYPWQSDFLNLAIHLLVAKLPWGEPPARHIGTPCPLSFQPRGGHTNHLGSTPNFLSPPGHPCFFPQSCFATRPFASGFSIAIWKSKPTPNPYPQKEDLR
jgi:hypothetical protein